MGNRTAFGADEKMAEDGKSDPSFPVWSPGKTSCPAGAIMGKSRVRFFSWDDETGKHRLYFSVLRCRRHHINGSYRVITSCLHRSSVTNAFRR